VKPWKVYWQTVAFTLYGAFALTVAPNNPFRTMFGVAINLQTHYFVNILLGLHFAHQADRFIWHHHAAVWALFHSGHPS
jgi:hypothetical protein